MASQSLRREENAPGNFYVDETCIDCAACRGLAPENFTWSRGFSAVTRQPANSQQERQALEALYACPTSSIGVEAKPGIMAEVRSSFPLKITENVYYCGFHDESSFGAASYLVIHQDGNILVDTPRPAAPLLRNIDKLGGVKYHYFTHRDDVGKYEEFSKRYSTIKMIHEDEKNAVPGAEMLLRNEVLKLNKEVTLIPVPGHTRGHTVLLYRDSILFSGDHLAYSPRLGHLYAFRDACWYSWQEQIKSMKKLAGFSFETVLPGHGRRYYARSKAEMSGMMQTCIRWMSQ